jgi:hypothetical protein
VPANAAIGKKRPRTGLTASMAIAMGVFDRGAPIPRREFRANRRERTA